MNVFFITGLPRSRTAWLANFLTWGSAVCMHDAFRFCRRVEDLPELFALSGAASIGNSDPANLAFQDRLHALFPEARWVLIRRNTEQAEAASRRAFGLDISLDYFQKKMEELIAKRRPLVVDFEALDIKAAQEIGRYCIPGFKSPLLRNEMLSHFNVQIHRPWLLEELSNESISPITTAFEP